MMMCTRLRNLGFLILLLATTGTPGAGPLNATEPNLGADQGTTNVQAHDAYLQGWAHYQLSTPTALAQAITYFDEAIRLDPDYAQAHAALASVYWDVYQNDWAFDLGMPSSRAESRANEHLELALKNPVPLAHVLQSRMFATFGFFGEAVVEAENAVALDGNDPTALAGLASALVKSDRPTAGLDYIEKAMRIDPNYPPTYLMTFGAAQFGIEDYRAAAVTFEQAVKRNPDNEMMLIYLASSYGHLGRIKDADQTIEIANGLRARLGMGELSLERKSPDGFSPFKGEIAFDRVGVKAAQQRLRDGLSGIPGLTWHYRITMKKSARTGSVYDVRYEVDGVTEIDIEIAKTLYDRSALFIDVSSHDFWAEGHIPGAVHLPYGRAAGPDRERFSETALRQIAQVTDDIVLHCHDRSGCSGSAFAAAKAANWGYQKIYTFVGGAPAWKEAGYPVEMGN